MIDPKTGEYTCSKDVAGEVSLYTNLERIGQQNVDHVRQLQPDWTEAQLHEYVDKGSITHVLPQIESCISSLGYDVTTLPHIAVPELPGEARELVLLAMSAPIVYRKLKDWKNENPGSSYRDLIKSGYKGLSKVVDKLKGTGSSYI